VQESDPDSAQRLAAKNRRDRGGAPDGAKPRRADARRSAFEGQIKAQGNRFARLPWLHNPFTCRAVWFMKRHRSRR